ncbi:MAG TPA: hypothetical protein VFJ16_05800 [Longimicrobium sp.]|nr:hypothetical protein [Longimicrobium sp.]
MNLEVILRRASARLAPVALLLAAACSDRTSALAPADPAPAAPLAAVQCRASVATRSLACSQALPSAPAGARHTLILGGQGVNLQLASSHVVYDSATQTLSADVTLQNLLGQAVGTADGVTPSGTRVFFHAPPVTVNGSGEVQVGNPDGVETFTGSVQPYFTYPGILQPYERTAPRRWEFSVPASVTTFTFQLYVQAALPNETGVLRFSQLHGSFVARNLNAAWGTGPGDVWVGGARTLMYFNGSRWALIPVQTNDAIVSLHGTSTADVWAAGSNDLVRHFDGRRWSPLPTGLTESWTVVHAAAPGDVYVAGGAFGKIAHWNGSAWTLLDPGTSGRRYGGAWGTGPNDVYLFGAQWNAGTKGYDGLVRHWDGETWSDTVLPGFPLGRAWASGPDDVWALGPSGAVAHWNGTAWTQMQITTFSLGGLWGSGPNDVYAAGGGYHTSTGQDGATVMHWDGTAWTEVRTGGPHNVRAVWGSSAGNVLALGDYGSVMRWDGARWSNLSVPGTEAFTSVFAAAGDDLYAAACGDGVMHSTDGASWSTVAAPGDCMTKVWGAEGRVFAAGYTVTGPAMAVVERWDGAAWQRDTFPGVRMLSGVWGTGPANVYAVGYSEGQMGGQSGTVLHWDGAAWTQIAVSGAYMLESVWGSGPSDIYAGGPQAVLHYDGTAWTPVQGHYWGADTYRDIWGTGPNDVFMIGARLYHWNGTEWSDFDPVTNFIGHAVWGSGPDDVYAVGTQTLHWNGQRWNFVDLDVSATFWGIHGLSRQKVWAVGENGVVIRGVR